MLPHHEASPRHRSHPPLAPLPPPRSTSLSTGPARYSSSTAANTLRICKHAAAGRLYPFVGGGEGKLASTFGGDCLR